MIKLRKQNINNGFAVRISDRSKMEHKNFEHKIRGIKQTKNYSTDTPGPPGLTVWVST